MYDKLANPSPDDPYEADIAAVRLESSPCSVRFPMDADTPLQLLKSDKAKFQSNAKEWTKK